MSKGPTNIEAGLEQLLVETNVERILKSGHLPDQFGRRFSQGEGGNRRIAGHRDDDGLLSEIVAVEVVPSIGGTEVRIDPVSLDITGRLTGYNKARLHKEISKEKALATASRVLGYLGSVVEREGLGITE